MAYTRWDNLIKEMGVHKVETVGEVYMVVSGAPTAHAQHAEFAANMALEIMDTVPEIRRQIIAELGPQKWIFDVHIGLNSGPIVAGVCGQKAPRYKLFGDTVNTARYSTPCVCAPSSPPDRFL